MSETFITTDGAVTASAQQRSWVLDLLTERQVEVLRRIACGETMAMIADELGVSQKTVDSHRANAMRKCDIEFDGTGNVHITRLMIREGLVRL